MKEDFLHFIWKFQYFDHQQLLTENNEVVQIKSSGLLNHNAGPDFLNATVVIDGIVWNGNIEIHVRSSDWYRHKHEQDSAYESTVLHVVWEHDKDICYADDTKIPVLSLKDKTPSFLLSRYEEIIASLSPIPCQAHLGNIEDFVFVQTFEKALIQRLEQKANQVKTLLVNNGGDWRETTYQLLAQNMGFKVNKDSFLNLAQKTKYSYVQKHIDQSHQVEAFLFGQSGLLPSKSVDDYTEKLQKEYTFLKQKYQLKPLTSVSWKFMRMRPANFPTIRIAQFAAILQKREDLFSKLIELEPISDYISFFQLNTSTYWDTHYRFGDKKEYGKKSLGKESIYNVLINTVAPLLACYAIEKDKATYMDRAISLLEAVPAEQNKITRLWKKNGIKFNNAANTQAAIQLFNDSCYHKKCLECTVGYSILKKNDK